MFTHDTPQFIGCGLNVTTRNRQLQLDQYIIYDVLSTYSKLSINWILGVLCSRSQHRQGCGDAATTPGSQAGLRTVFIYREQRYVQTN